MTLSFIFSRPTSSGRSAQQAPRPFVRIPPRNAYRLRAEAWTTARPRVSAWPVPFSFVKCRSWPRPRPDETFVRRRADAPERAQHGMKKARPQVEGAVSGSGIGIGRGCGTQVGSAPCHRRWFRAPAPRHGVHRLLNSPAFPRAPSCIHGSSMAEQRTVNPLVVGSSPTRGARRSIFRPGGWSG